MRPTVICLCGSSKFCDILAVMGWILERDEGAITLNLHLLPNWYTRVESHLAEKEGVAAAMDALHKRKIDLADEIFVVDWEGYIGDSTRSEIDYATKRDKTVRYLSKEPYLDRVMEVLG